MPPTTTHVTIFVGGNDANIIGTAVGAGLGGGDPRGYINGHVSQWGRDLAELVSRVRNRAPKKYGWTGAFGIMVTVIWLYLEILRMLAIARD